MRDRFRAGRECALAPHRTPWRRHGWRSRPGLEAATAKRPEHRSAISLAGKGKTLQEWERLWREWNGVVEEAGHEHGEYVLQEADHVELDQPAVRKFVLGLPDDELRALLESMTRQRSTKRWADLRGRSISPRRSLSRSPRSASPRLGG